MMAQIIDRKRLKADTKDLLSTAQVSPKTMAALYLGLILVLNLLDTAAGGTAEALTDRNLLGIFVYVLASLVITILSAGFVLYCMTIRRGERAEFLTLFDGFTLVGKLIGLQIVTNLFIALWAMLFVIPGIIAAYRYRFALYNLLEDPDIGILEALEMSKRQTNGYKSQLFLLDMSYLGWELLASLPVIPYSWQFSMTMLSGSAVGPQLPALVWTLAIGLWSLAVSLFYLPNYQCVELAYFEIAKSTSGVGFDVPPRQPNSTSGQTGPDGLGGL